MMKAKAVWHSRDARHPGDFYDPGEHHYFGDCMVVEFPIREILDLQQLEQEPGFYTQINGTSGRGVTWCTIVVCPEWHPDDADPRKMIVDALNLAAWG